METKAKSLLLPLLLLALLILLIKVFVMMLYKVDWLVIGLSSVIYLTCVTLIYIVSRLAGKQHKNLDELQLSQLKALKRTFKQLAKQSAKPNPYDTPWYFTLCSEQQDIATQMRAMGFEPINKSAILGIGFWRQKKAVMIVLNQDEPMLDIGLEALCKQLLKHRPRQPMNGVLVDMPLPLMLSDNSALLNDTAAHQRTLLIQINRMLNISLPVYCSITQLNVLQDFCESFALALPIDAMNQQDKPQLLGSLLPQEQPERFQLDWFEQSFDELFNQLYRHHQGHLESLIQDQSINVVAAAPLQFYELKQSLKGYLVQLFETAQDNESFRFRGYFFSSHGQAPQQLDQLSMNVANRLGYQSIPVSPSIIDKPPLFIASVLNNILDNESPLVGSRRAADRHYYLSKLFGYSAIVGIFSALGLLAYNNYTFHENTDKAALRLVNTIDISAVDKALLERQPDAFNLMAQSLWQLRDATLLFEQHKPSFISEHNPIPTIKDTLKQSYQQLNGHYLLNFVRARMEDEITRLLGESATSGETYMQMHQKYESLFLEQRDDYLELVSFYASQLPLTDETRLPVKQMLYDAMAQNNVATEPDTRLLNVVAKQVVAKDFPAYIYNTLISSQPFNQKMDMAPALDEELFDFTTISKQQLYVHYAFTKDGFVELNQQFENGTIDKLINRYSHLLSAHERVTVKRRTYSYISKHYVHDYIKTWQTFEQNTKPVAHLKELPLNPLLAKLIKKQSSLDNYYALIAYHTNLAQPTDDKIDEDFDNPSRPAPLAEQHIKRQSMMANNLSQTFSGLHDWHKQNRLKSHYQAVNKWLVHSANDQQLMQALAQNSGFPHFTQQAETPDYAARLSVQLENVVNHYNMQQARDFINRGWQAGVLRYYKQKLHGRFPFQHLSEQDTALGDFAEFFKSGGIVDQFSSRYLKLAKTNAQGQLYLTDFTSNKQWQFAKPLSEFIDRAKIIQSLFFDNNQLAVQVYLKVDSMSPQLLSLSVIQERPLFHYQHGPKLRHQLNWPYKGSADEPLMFVTQSTASRQQTQFNGPWSWFRFAYQGLDNRREFNAKKVRGQQGRTVHQLVLPFQDKQVEIAIETSSKLTGHPFDIGLLNRLNVPTWL